MLKCLMCKEESSFVSPDGVEAIEVEHFNDHATQSPQDAEISHPHQERFFWAPKEDLHLATQYPM